jgi:hypothetical protein
MTFGQLLEELWFKASSAFAAPRARLAGPLGSIFNMFETAGLLNAFCRGIEFRR